MLYSSLFFLLFNINQYVKQQEKKSSLKNHYVCFDNIRSTTTGDVMVVEIGLPEDIERFTNIIKNQAVLKKFRSSMLMLSPAEYNLLKGLPMPTKIPKTSVLDSVCLHFVCNALVIMLM